MAKVTRVIETRETFGSRIGRFITLMLVVIGVTGTIVFSQRFSSETLALIAGIVIVGAPMLAILGLFGFVFLKVVSNQRQPPQQMTIPPIIMQIPQNHGYDGQFALPDEELLKLRRQGSRSWEVVGDDD